MWGDLLNVPLGAEDSEVCLEGCFGPIGSAASLQPLSNTLCRAFYYSVYQSPHLLKSHVLEELRNDTRSLPCVC